MSTARVSEMNLENTVVLVTGGGKGIGRGIVEVLLEHGSHVVIAQRSPLDNLLEEDPRVSYFSTDFSATTNFSPLIENTVAEFCRLDALVNCAGLMFEQDTTDVTLEAWDAMTAVNLRAPLLLTQAAPPYLPEGGSIINIGSIEGISANPQHAVYAASKGGLHAMTRALAVDLGIRGIRCNAIAPGWIESNLSEAYLASTAIPANAREQLRKLHPVGRLGQPRDIENAVAFLISDMASFINGEVLVVDGGRTAQLPTPS